MVPIMLAALKPRVEIYPTITIRDVYQFIKAWQLHQFRLVKNKWIHVLLLYLPLLSASASI